MRRVVFNQKGGVGKSSIACNLAAIAASRGRRVLVVDLDPQGNSTLYLLGRSPEGLIDTVADLLEQTVSFTMFNRPPEEFVHGTRFDGLAVMPASPELEFLERKLEAKHKIYKLRGALEKLDDAYDEIYIDTAPSLNFYARAALVAADRCLIPFDCDDFSRQALYNTLNEIGEIREDHNENLMVEAIIANQYQPRAKLPRQVMQELLDEGLPVSPVRLSGSVKMKESHQNQEPLIYMAPSHPLTVQYAQLYDALAGKPVAAG